MEKTFLRSLQDCEDLLEGALWLGTGGGGSFEEGMEKFKKVLDEGLTLEWVPAGQIQDDTWTVTIGLHGSIAPLSPVIESPSGRPSLTMQCRGH